VVQVVDRRREDLGRTGLYSTATVKALRSRGRVLGVLNRTGRSRLLACRSCGELARCEVCESAVRQVAEGRLRCHRCDAERPPVCDRCGSVSFKNLRVGVTRAREELEALVGEPVAEVSGDTAGSALPEVRVFVGTEAVLHQVDGAEAVVFLDFDQELLVPRYRAAEQAFGLLVRAARVVGDRAHGGRILVQTRLPRHEAIVAALHADPSRLASVERERRRALGYPPFEALAEVSGAAAELFVERLERSTGVEIRGPQEGRWRLRATDHETLCDALAGVDRPPGRLRVAVDPLRI
jgi:primosomal protein N' (replication factor Y)